MVSCSRSSYSSGRGRYTGVGWVVGLAVVGVGIVVFVVGRLEYVEVVGVGPKPYV